LKVARTVVVVLTPVAFGAGAMPVTVGLVVSAATLFTVTATDADAVLPAASRAIAVSVWLAFEAVVVFHATEYGATTSSAPRLTPSTLNCTPATPTLSEAEAETVTALPETVAPSAGAVKETVGRVESGVATVNVKSPATVALPAASALVTW